jgi:hypothetical protein
MRLPILLFTLLPLTASAQRFTLGLEGGIPAQTPLGKTDQTPFAIGPSVNVQVFGGLSFETGLLYDRIGRRSDNSTFFFPENTVTLGFSSSKGSALEVPLLAKFRFLHARNVWRPFLTAGPTVRRTSITTDQFSSTFSGSPLGTAANGLAPFHRATSQWNVDPAAGAGVDIRTGRFHLEPEVRYSYWAAGKNSLVRKNQVNFMLGFRF